MRSKATKLNYIIFNAISRINRTHFHFHTHTQTGPLHFLIISVIKSVTACSRLLSASLIFIKQKHRKTATSFTGLGVRRRNKRDEMSFQEVCAHRSMKKQWRKKRRCSQPKMILQHFETPSETCPFPSSRSEHRWAQALSVSRTPSRIMISFIKLIKDDNDDDEEMLNGR